VAAEIPLKPQFARGLIEAQGGVHLPVTSAIEDALMSDGYDSTFLIDSVPLATPDRRTVILDYPRFSVVLDVDRRPAAVTAVNIDGASLRDIPRTGDWALDPRVPAEQQAGPDVYAP
jgi:DNA/RNA endonuclease G (NUC1)